MTWNDRVRISTGVPNKTVVWENPQTFKIKVDNSGSIDYSSGDWESESGDNNKDVRNRRIAEVKSLLSANNVNYNPK